MCAAGGQACVRLHPGSTSMSSSPACSCQPGTTKPLIALTHLPCLDHEVHLSSNVSLWPLPDGGCRCPLPGPVPSWPDLGSASSPWVWQPGLLALVTVVVAAPLAWVLWECALAGDSPFSPLALGLPALESSPA